MLQSFFKVKKIRKIWDWEGKSQQDKPPTPSTRAELRNVSATGLHSLLWSLLSRSSRGLLNYGGKKTNTLTIVPSRQHGNRHYKRVISLVSSSRSSFLGTVFNMIIFKTTKENENHSTCHWSSMSEGGWCKTGHVSLPKMSPSRWAEVKK